MNKYGADKEPFIFIIDFDLMSRTLHDLFNVRSSVCLEKVICVPQYAMRGIYKCRVVYDEKSTEVEFEPYYVRPIRSLKIVHDNNICYSYKFTDRSEINRLMELRGACDDILIIKNGKVTDSSYANVIFKDLNDTWFTPSTYLLAGTMRSYLLKNRIIEEADIGIAEIKNYIEVRLINAMKGIEDSESLIVSEVFL